MTRVPRHVPITRQQVNDLGFHVGTRFRAIHNVFEGKEGVITAIKQYAHPVFGRPDEIAYTTCIETKLDDWLHVGSTCCFYNPAQLEIIG